MKILLTGGAGFIGSNLTKALLADERVTKVRIMDNFLTGSKKNLHLLEKHPKFELLETDIREVDSCRRACEGIDLISHQAALGSVPRSISNPIITNDININGTLNIFQAAKENNIQRIVFAASSSTYGDNKELPKREDNIGKPLSPYAITKFVNELYAQVFADLYGIEYIGLRYFNVFGPQQSPTGAYAAVIPLFMRAAIEKKSPIINGDGSVSRDFTFVENVVQANISALFTKNKEAINKIYNIACGNCTSLQQLYVYIKNISGQANWEAIYGEKRKGDIQDSLADISKAKKLLNYEPNISVEEGLGITFEWYKKNIDIFN